MNVILILFLVGLLISALPLRSYKVSSPPGECLSLSELPSLPDLKFAIGQQFRLPQAPKPLVTLAVRQRYQAA
jgi:hypothetical protein